MIYVPAGWITGGIALLRIGTLLIALAGFSLISWGVSMYSTPAGWILGGASLLVIAYDANRVPAAPKPAAGGE